MDLAEFIDTYRDAIAQRVVASYPALRERPPPPAPAPLPARHPGGRHPRRCALPRSPPRHHRRRRDGHRQDLHHRLRRPRCRLPPGAGALPAAPRPQVEARGRRDRAPCPRRHRHLHHRPGATPCAPKPALRDHVAGARQALLPLAARHGRVLGRVRRPARRPGPRQGSSSTAQGASDSVLSDMAARQSPVLPATALGVNISLLAHLWRVLSAPKRRSRRGWGGPVSGERLSHALWLSESSSELATRDRLGVAGRDGDERGAGRSRHGVRGRRG